jgi:hypothetical protein
MFLYLFVLVREIVIRIGALRRHGARRERPAKGGGDPGLIGQIFNLDDPTFHGSFACGALFRFH